MSIMDLSMNEEKRTQLTNSVLSFSGDKGWIESWKILHWGKTSFNVK